MTFDTQEKKHNVTDFERCHQINSLEDKLKRAKKKIKVISATAERRLDKINEVLKKNKIVVEAHNKLVDKYGSKKNECYDKEDMIRAIDAERCTKIMENKYLKD